MHCLVSLDHLVTIHGQLLEFLFVVCYVLLLLGYLCAQEHLIWI